MRKIEKKTKSYSSVCKCRGFQLNFTNSVVINHEFMKTMILEDQNITDVTENPRKLTLCKKHRLFTIGQKARNIHLYLQREML